MIERSAVERQTGRLEHRGLHGEVVGVGKCKWLFAANGRGHVGGIVDVAGVLGQLHLLHTRRMPAPRLREGETHHWIVERLNVECPLGAAARELTAGESGDLIRLAKHADDLVVW